MFKSILVPLDGSRLAAAVLPWVRTIARATKAEIILTSVVSPQVVWDPLAGQGDWESVEGEYVAYLKEQQEALTAAGFSVRTTTRSGDPWQAICQCAESEGAQLIAMTTHGRSGLGRWALGSVADRVVHESPTPVLLIRPEEGPSEPDANVERIIVPIDGSELSVTAVPYAGELARALGATVMAVHVITPFAITYPGTEAYVDQRVMDQLEASAKEMLISAGDRLRAMGLTAEQLLTRGTPADGIISAAVEGRADLIVMSTHGRSGVGRWVMGSVADAVVRRSHLPCLLRRPEQAQPDAPGPNTAAD